MKKNLLLRLVHSLGLLIPSLYGQGQVFVTGPQCVTPGVIYQYMVTGAMDSTSKITVCATGGMIQNTTSNCFSGQNAHYVLVLWNSATAKGSVDLSGPLGNATLAVTIFKPLDGGLIDTFSSVQSVAYLSSPRQINCTPASGGTCSSKYAYQWQISVDAVSWADLPGHNGEGLLLGVNLRATSFFRRKVVEQGTGTVSYSNAAQVFVGPEPAATNTPSTTVTNQ